MRLDWSRVVLKCATGTGEALVKLDCHPDIVYSACFNWDGSQLLTTCKDKKIRMINPRTGEVESEAICHEGKTTKTNNLCEK